MKNTALKIVNILENLFSCSNGVTVWVLLTVEHKGYFFYAFPNLGSVVISARRIMDFVDDCTLTLCSSYTSGIFRVCNYSNF
jgi:hypothetical protein